VKKILITKDISKILLEKPSFLNRDEFRLFAAATNDEALQIHRSEHMDLIITDLDMAGMSSEQFCSLIRKDPELRQVSIILVCAYDKSAYERSSRFGADAIILRPIKPHFLLTKAKQLLSISMRETYRVPLNVAVEGQASDRAFSCRSLDISTVGILMETSQTFEPEQLVICSFTLPDTTLIKVTGKIVRTLDRPAGIAAHRYGIHFLDLKPEAHKAIETYLNSAARKKRPAIY
jgi:DNA-binding response OmpR family regulator